MTTTVDVPWERWVRGRLVESGVNHVVLEGKKEEQYLADLNVRNAYQALRSWSQDASLVVTDWANMTQGQKDAALRVTIQRLGVFFDRFADLLVLMDKG